MKWKLLLEVKEEMLPRGALIRFDAGPPFEHQVVMMVSEFVGEEGLFGLVTVSGYKAGIVPYCVFPLEAKTKFGVSVKWLIENWKKWVWPEQGPDGVFVHSEPLTAGQF